MKKTTDALCNSRGQVAIFVALIFQVLFVFFAMVVNLGLLVHHKINLQNSVDLAAYYGAMKQAEVLNVIAHMNYQIRQSWKLFAFRYRHLGYHGDDSQPFRVKDYTNAPYAASTNLGFCINYSPFSHMFSEGAVGENYCKHPITNIRLPGRPGYSPVNFIIGGLAGVQSAIIAASEAARRSVQNDCKTKTAINWYALVRFLYAYKMDIANRKQILLHLANRLSNKGPDDFTDIDGQSALAGAQQTLKKNLSYPNEEGGLKIQFINSLGQGSCGVKGGDLDAPGWLSENYIYPLVRLLDGQCGAGDQVTYSARYINTGAEGVSPDALTEPYGSVTKELLQYVQEPDGSNPQQRLYKSSLGFEKNPWCMAYVGVGAETTPKIPFAPFGAVTLRARAFAKPFGGSIGPWYAKRWENSVPFSGNSVDVPINDRTDMRAPPRVAISSMVNDANDPTMIPDHSRYVGDLFGTDAKLTAASYGDAIELAGRPKTGNVGSMALSWWDELVTPALYIGSPSAPGDILAWDPQNPTVSVAMRNLEIAAIAPDNFDVSYYSIEPDFYRNYYLRLRDQIEGKLGISMRGDLGMRKLDTGEWKAFSVKDQMSRVWTIQPLDFNKLTYFAGRQSTPAHAFFELLTSFKAKSPEDTSITKYFADCKVPVSETSDARAATPGNCIAGGRVGYSVKLVDGLSLNSEMTINGVSGRILNPWTR